MKKLYLIGIISHLEYEKDYLDAVIKTGANTVFIEETNISWNNSCQKNMYYDFLSNNIRLIPVYPKEDVDLDKMGIAYLELNYALNIKKNLSKNDSCFTVGAMHLGPNGFESSLEYALKEIKCGAEIVVKNFFKDYPENYPEIINDRKKIISGLIQGLF